MLTLLGGRERLLPVLAHQFFELPLVEQAQVFPGQLAIPASGLLGEQKGLQPAAVFVLGAEADEPHGLPFAFVQDRYHAQGFFLAALAHVGCHAFTPALKPIEGLADQARQGVLDDIQVRQGA